MKRLITPLLLLAAMVARGQSQNGVIWDNYYITGSTSIGAGKSFPDSSTILLVGKDSSNRAMILPRVVHLNAITSPKRGMLVWCYDSTALVAYTGSKWLKVGAAPNLAAYYNSHQTDSAIANAVSPVSSTASTALGQAQAAQQTAGIAADLANQALDAANNAPNFANANLQLTDDRQHDAAKHQLSIVNLTQLLLTGHADGDGNYPQYKQDGNGASVAMHNDNTGDESVISATLTGIDIHTSEDGAVKAIAVPRAPDQPITIEDDNGYAAEYANDYSGMYNNRSIPDVSYVNQQIANAGYLSSESEPYYSSSAAAGISSGNIVSWNTAATQSATNASNITSLNTTITGKQQQLNGTGIVKASGTTITYDNTSYLSTGSAATTYAPITSSTNYVQNQSAITQSASYKISGSATAATVAATTSVSAPYTGTTSNTQADFGANSTARFHITPAGVPYFDGPVGFGGLSGANGAWTVMAGSNANTACTKWLVGSLNTTAQSGAEEYDGTNWYRTPTDGARRILCLSGIPTTGNAPSSFLTYPLMYDGDFTFTTGGSGAGACRMPAISSTYTGHAHIIFIANTSSYNLVINTSSGGNDLFIGGSASSSFTLASGGSITFINNGTYFVPAFKYP